jgi:hypothetical protein
MAENRKTKSFWTTLPGILTGLAAVIVAISGLIGGLVAGGLLDGLPETPPADQSNTSTSSQTLLLSDPALTPVPPPATESVPVSIPSPEPAATLAPATSAPPEPTAPIASNCSDTPLIGTPAREFPRGGDSFLDAVSISPGLYLWKRSLEPNVYAYYKVGLRADQRVIITFRTPNIEYPYAGASIYDGNGDLLITDAIIGERSRKKTLEWQAGNDGEHYITIGNEFGINAPDTLYLVCIG